MNAKLIIAICLCLVTLVARAADDDGTILGSWKVTACETAGAADDACEKGTWEITKDAIVVTEGTEKWKLTITMLDTSSLPWKMDWRCDAEDRRFVAKGIVRSDGRSLQICGVAGDDLDKLARPTTFRTTKDDGGRIMCLLTKVDP